ncbi:MAG: HPr family phosphocarrier protein [Lachnospiraceae bacterium]|nr:HPr family phosphocarrier protein [Lachnospiraceae bacterium]
MKKFSYTITDEVGIHGRPAGMLVKKASEYQSAVTLTSKGKSADAKRIMAVMGLGVKKGDSVEFSIDGADEAVAAKGLEDFMKANL